MGVKQFSIGRFERAAYYHGFEWKACLLSSGTKFQVWDRKSRKLMGTYFPKLKRFDPEPITTPRIARRMARLMDTLAYMCLHLDEEACPKGGDHIFRADPEANWFEGAYSNKQSCIKCGVAGELRLG